MAVLLLGCAAPAILPAFVRDNINVRKIIPCINGSARRASVLLVTKSGSSLTKFLAATSYIKKSLRLNSKLLNLASGVVLAQAAEQ